MAKFDPNQIPCCSWDQLREELDNRISKRWLFRGACASVGKKRPISLESSIERVGRVSGMSPESLVFAEWEMIRDFRRKYEGVDKEEVEDDELYCLSVMRHYGAPTRLLDWTYSPYVALYFALERWEPKNRKADKQEVVVWCLDQDWCDINARETDPIVKRYLPEYRRVHIEELENLKAQKRKKALFHELFMCDRYRFVFAVNPSHLHTRLTIQQGVFLCPGDVTTGIVDILSTYKLQWEDRIGRISWMPKNSIEIVTALDYLNSMNINRASLFPGLDGFAQSFKYRLSHYYEQAQRSWKLLWRL